MNKLRQILEFIRALLGFLLNLKKRKKKKDEKNEKPAHPIPDEVPDDVPQEGIGIVSGCPRNNSPVGGPFRGGTGMYRSPLDTLGVRTGYTRQAASFVGWTLFSYAVGMSFWGA
ncbi:MAG: hypothetical protein J6J40_08900 [Parabacteroides sp.]|nr:hypothetical protein [Parabacteroides sp.]